MSLEKLAVKSKKGQRVLDDRAPKRVENTKKCMFIKGGRTSQVTKQAEIDLAMIKAPHVKKLTRNNDGIRPFEDQSSLEFLCQKNDTSLFAFASKTKKRPHALTLGRTFDWQVLDMFEFNINEKTFKSVKDLAGDKQLKPVIHIGSKPALLFNGEEFEHDVDFIAMKNFFIDFFKGDVMQKINLASVDHVITFTSCGKMVYFRHYAIALRKNPENPDMPQVVLEEYGPRMDMTFSRRTGAVEDVQKQAREQPKDVNPRKRKNVSKGLVGAKLGRIHMQRQNLAEMALRKLKKRDMKNKISSAKEQ
jgi:ribosome production factor 2